MKKIPQNMNILFFVLKMSPPPHKKKKNTANAALKTNRETFICLFVSLRVIAPLETETSPLLVKGC